jgi:hypothetical protein
MNVNKQFLFGCGQMGGKYGQRKGILEKHAYSIMEAREINGERLLKLRNPWGNSEWTGAWSDGSAEWTPEWMNLLNHKFGDDGVRIQCHPVAHDAEKIDRSFGYPTGIPFDITNISTALVCLAQNGQSLRAGHR